jgi:nucleotide-binding universal stress UspA family protein
MTSPPENSGGWSCLIVGYDRTDSARLAAAWAARQLRPDGKLVILHACRPLHAQPSPLSGAKERRELARALIDELLLEDAGQLLEVDVEADISDDDPVTALTAAARRHGAQGIVVGHERHSRLHRALGTVTTELLSSSPVPVITVPLSAAEISEQTPTQSGGRSR